LALMVARPPRTDAGGGIVTIRDEAQARALFQERYGNRPSPTTREIERRVIGGDWGANGFTTMAQADTLARELGLSVGDRLLDLGSGRGWPGLYLAAPDRLPSRPGRPARGRAAGGRRPREQRRPRRPDLRGRRRGQRAAVPGQQLRCRHPHRRAVLLRAKLSVLRASRRLLRPDGRLGFYTVESPGLSSAARRRARRAGPRAVAMRSDHQRLLRTAGFDDVTELDVTSAFAATAAAWLAETEPHAQELARPEAPGAFAQRQADRRSMLAAIHAGLLRRTLLLARRR
jgi:hypothetical protein